MDNNFLDKCIIVFIAVILMIRVIDQMNTSEMSMITGNILLIAIAGITNLLGNEL